VSDPGNAFELAIRVGPDDIDELGHANNTVALRWVQDAAAAHWRRLAPASAQSEIAWVVLRHEIDYKAPAFAGDELVARTWVGTASGMTFERHTEIRRTGDDRLIARARTLWCPISLATGQPRRVTAELRALFSSP